MKLSNIRNYFYPHRILDIGANIGQFHIIAKQQYPDSFIFSIEASDACEDSLKQITAKLKKNLIILNNANRSLTIIEIKPIDRLLTNNSL